MDTLKRKLIRDGAIAGIVSAAFVIAGLIMVYSGAWPGAIFSLLGVGFFVGIWRQLKGHYTRVERMRERNFDWYRATHASHFSNGRVTCHKCGCNHISVRGVMQQTYMREHACTQCGETLYYSPEGMAGA